MRIDALALHGMRVGAVWEGQQKHLHVPVKRRETAADWQFPRCILRSYRAMSTIICTTVTGGDRRYTTQHKNAGEWSSTPHVLLP
jgi:hypothetical protein